MEQLLGLWNDGDLPGLRGMVKAMFREGRFTHASGDTAVLALPNEVHRQKCEQRRAEVEAALTDRAGFAVRLQLVVDEGGDTSAPPTSGDRPRRAPETGPDVEPEPDDFDLGGTDVHDLDDAPDAPAGGLDALTEAFPGAELVEGT